MGETIESQIIIVGQAHMEIQMSGSHKLELLSKPRKKISDFSSTICMALTITLALQRKQLFTLFQDACKSIFIY